ncbi:hypothetical protein GIB67_011264 [Kingdonia uniflora]|uniref:Alpha/beta hydrolase fold-3 domain-containing protein n=1 Tax=Kingdonia uniflora TaxID=39325 RepID=A0A7J7NA98_9MAGN|nr:hypothetical protein GIB67_011264 [Kingdonia uniflora]
MDSNKAELDYEFLPFLRVYKDGHVERLLDSDTKVALASFDPLTGVTSKDIVIIPETGVSARVYVPKLVNTNQKLPILVYFHGGAFCSSSTFSPIYHNHLNSLVLESNIVVVSVDYRLAPEHPLPIAYEDSWAALQWVASHCDRKGPETVLNENVDLARVFLAGDSAGANIAHIMAMRVGDPDIGLNVRLLGIALIHPYFWGSEPIGSETLDLGRKAFVDRLWPFVCPSMPDSDHPYINPVAVGAPSLHNLGCARVLVCVAEKDILKDRGWLYYESLGRCGWIGVVEIMEAKGEEHVFHLHNPDCQNASDLVKRLSAFINRDMPPLL